MASEAFSNPHSMGPTEKQRELFIRLPIFCVSCGYDLVVDLTKADLGAIASYDYVRPCPKCSENMFTTYIPFCPR